MHKYIVFVLLCLTWLLPAGTLHAASDQHHHHQQPAGHQNLKLNDGKRWATDAPLRQGMQHIRSAVADRLDAVHHERASEAEYQTLAQIISEQLDFMFSNCKLPAEADAQLHILLADIVAANQMIAEGDKPRSGVISLVQTLERYPQYFDHPGWEPLSH